MSRAEVDTVMQCLPFGDPRHGEEGPLEAYEQHLPGGRVLRLWRSRHVLEYDWYRAYPPPLPIVRSLAAPVEPRGWRAWDGIIKYRDGRVVAVASNDTVILGEGLGQRVDWPPWSWPRDRK